MKVFLSSEESFDGFGISPRFPALIATPAPPFGGGSFRLLLHFSFPSNSAAATGFLGELPGSVPASLGGDFLVGFLSAVAGSRSTRLSGSSGGFGFRRFRLSSFDWDQSNLLKNISLF